MRIALLICYDVEFPEPSKRPPWRVPISGRATAQMTPFDFVADHLVRVRAWENQVYIAYVNHDGAEGSRPTSGAAASSQLSGRCWTWRRARTGLVVADVSAGVVERARAENPYCRPQARPVPGAAPRAAHRP
ncbi:hypothetical protein HBB16_03830 [Pseudonocardia sp. MCCB 268]|nr:hypothetical protein [Pseudonocardia cytotoxica]